MNKYVIGFFTLSLASASFGIANACEIYNSQPKGYLGKFSEGMVYNTQGLIGKVMSGEVFDGAGGYSGFYELAKTYNTQGAFEGYLDGRKLRSAWNSGVSGRLENCLTEEDAQAASAAAFLLLEL